MKEEEIRPKAIFEEYLRLAQADAVFYFSDVERISGRCPACDAAGQFAFRKHGFDYECCETCKTLFVNPRPMAEAFSRYYTESPSSKFWASTFYKETAEARREKLWKPKAALIAAKISRYAPDGVQPRVIDIGGGYGIFAEEIQGLTSLAPVVIEPGPQLAAICREKGLPVVEKFLEEVVTSDLPEGSRTFVSFELFEHLHNPAIFLAALSNLMSDGDLFIFTTLSGRGVDILAQWQNSNAVTPPHHLNFLNPKSVRMLLNRIGLQTLEVTTPGKLDLDILANGIAGVEDRFWQTFIAHASDEDRRRWQELIASTGWSSHMMVVCRKSVPT